MWLCAQAYNISVKDGEQTDRVVASTADTYKTSNYSNDSWISPTPTEHFGASAFERRTLDGFPPTPRGDSRSLAWVRPRRGVWDKALLAMVTDNSAPRAMYALSRVMTTTLSLTVYLHARADELAELGDDFILIECEGRVGGGGLTAARR